MRGVDHSSCNWDGDDVVDGCPTLKVFGISAQGREIITAHERSTYEIELNSSEDFPR